MRIPIGKEFETGMFERLVENRVVEALSDTPVVLIVGLRRAGKTTPVGWLSKAFFLPVLREFIARRRLSSEVYRAR